ncbi:MAG TPA: DUF3300 domain-containing protein [Candidatus Angelobacter sp.]
MVILTAVMCCLLTLPAMAQEGPPQYSPGDLDRMVSRIALYPDPLLAQTLAAATFPDQIPDAARWSDQHHYLSGDGLAQAISADQVPWDPSVQALLPFPSVLDMMARDMPWTSSIGNAFLAQQQDVMAAVQRMRYHAREFGYLRTGPEVIVGGGPYITILPVRPEFVTVPYYDPAVVFVAPRPGFFVGAGISFRFGVTLGPVFRPWGWGVNRIGWGERVVYINNARWGRTWVNRTTYVHPYTIRRVAVARAPDWHDHHELVGRSERERSAERYGHARVEEHHYEAPRHAEAHHDDHGHGDDHGHDHR